MTRWYPQRPSRFPKRLTDLEPPTLRLNTPHDRFTADLQRLNHYFWSTEIALSTTLQSYLSYDGSLELAGDVLAASGAEAFLPTVETRRPHYHGKMGSLLVQLRWNYDALGRYAVVEVVSILESLVDQLFAAALAHKVPSSFEGLYRALREMGIALDERLVLRAQIIKLVRNFLIHHRASQFDFPPLELHKALDGLRHRAVAWDTHENWRIQVDTAYRELLETTAISAKQRDLPQLFYFAVRAMAWTRKYGDAVDKAAQRMKPNVGASL